MVAKKTPKTQPKPQPQAEHFIHSEMTPAPGLYGSDTKLKKITYLHCPTILLSSI